MILMSSPSSSLVASLVTFCFLLVPAGKLLSEDKESDLLLAVVITSFSGKLESCPLFIER